MGLRGYLVVLDQQHPEQDEVGGLHVEGLVVERLAAHPLGVAQELRVHVAGKRKPPAGQRRQRAEHLDIAVAKFLELGIEFLLLVTHHSTLSFASVMTLRHFGSSLRTMSMSSSG